MAEPANILIVDDEEPIRMVWERFLSRWGYRAHLAENGQIGLAMSRASLFPLVITDLSMPVMGGQELVRTLKREQPDIEVIVTTGQGTIEIAVDMMKAGAYDFVTKPINFSSAEFIVRKCMEKVQTREENKRLRAINRDLEELNRVKEKFIAITSHELRTPVSIIGNILEVLDSALAGKEEEPLLRMAKTASAQLRETVLEMHELSQLKSAQGALQISRFPLRALFEEIVSEVSLAAKERGHRITWQSAEGLDADADRTKLKKMLRELLQNAIKFTADGGAIALDAHPGEDNELLVSVTDNGIGIPAEESEKIFQLFYEVSDSLHHHSSEVAFKGGGMGVGLAIVNDIVHAHGGSVRVESKVGQGSRFLVVFPQSPAGSRI